MKLGHIPKSKDLIKLYEKVCDMVRVMKYSIDNRSAITIGDDSKIVVYNYNSIVGNDPQKISVDVLKQCRALILSELVKNKKNIE